MIWKLLVGKLCLFFGPSRLSKVGLLLVFNLGSFHMRKLWSLTDADRCGTGMHTWSELGTPPVTCEFLNLFFFFFYRRSVITPYPQQHQTLTHLAGKTTAFGQLSARQCCGTVHLNGNRVRPLVSPAHQQRARLCKRDHSRACFPPPPRVAREMARAHPTLALVSASKG